MPKSLWYDVFLKCIKPKFDYTLKLRNHKQADQRISVVPFDKFDLPDYKNTALKDLYSDLQGLVCLIAKIMSQVYVPTIYCTS